MVRSQTISEPSVSAPAPALAPELVPDTRESRRSVPPISGTQSGVVTALSLLTVDVLMFATSSSAAYLALRLVGAPEASLSLLLRMLVLLGGLEIATLWTGRLYGALPSGPVLALSQLIKRILYVTGFVVLTLLVLGQSPAVILALLAAGGLSAALLPSGRLLLQLLCGRRSWWGRRVFIVGSDARAVSIYARLMRQPQRGLRPVGFVDDLETLDPNLDPTLYLGPPDALRELAITMRTSAVVVAKADADAETQRLFCREELGIRDWIVMSSLDGYPSLWTEAVEVAGAPAFSVRNRLLAPGARHIKRLCDLAITVTGVLLGLPLIVAIIALVRLSSPGPIFYCNKRIGRHGRRFMAWKFRTMVVNAEEVLEDYLASDPLLRAEWEEHCKLKRDPRITWIGHFLRQTSLDELPQLWNVLRGEMSLVGPRPILESEIEKYAGEYEYYVDVLPGITGLWQVSGRNNTTYRERIGFVTYYVKNWSLWLDLYILISTVRVVLFREGAY